MIIIKRLFAEKILRYYENSGRLAELFSKVPGIGSAIDKQVTDKGNVVIKHLLGVVAQLADLVWVFIKKMLFVIAFVWLPYYILSKSCPLIGENRNLAITFLFFVICTISGSIVNNVVSVVDDRDYIMTKVVLISPAINCLGKLVYKMITDFICFAIVLCIMKLPVHISFLLSMVNMCARPIGELITIFMYEKSKLLYNNKGSVYGTVMALAVILSYGTLFIMRNVSDFWSIVYNPVFVVVMFVLGVLAFLVICSYRNYEKIVSDTIALK